MWYIIIGFIVMLIIGFIISGRNAKKQAGEKEKQNDYLDEHSYVVSAEYNYSTGLNSQNIRFIVDETNEKVLISQYGLSFKTDEETGKIIVSQTGVPFKTIDFQDIIGCEIVTDSEVTGGIGRAVAGGILAGGAGAIVGAVTAKQHILSYEVVIYLNSISSPKYTIPLIRGKTSTKSVEYSEAAVFANNINATIKAIVSKYQ